MGSESSMAAPLTRRRFVSMLAVAGATAATAGMLGCSGAAGGSSSSSGSSAATTVDITLNDAAWSYDADNDVYYQIGVNYCERPAAPTYESMGVYVPGAYFDAKDNGDGTFTCTPSESGQVNGYTAATAPVVMPINTAGYSAQAAPASYNANGITSYLQAGFVYVYAGCRGRGMSDSASGAAPWGVTDLKSAVRALRYNDARIPGDKNRIFSFGHSGGGAQSAVLGASGDAEGYDDYLATIGAPAVDADGKALSDSICGAMCWCPITNLDQANAAYEWNMGQFASSGTRADGTFTQLLSRNLATSYAEYINGLGLKDGAGTELLLKEGGEGIYTSGTYYDYVKSVVEGSLNTFLAETEFPYTPSNSFNADMGAGGGAGAPSDDAPSGSAPSGDAPSGAAEDGQGGQDSSSSESTTYNTAADYIAHLNEGTAWVEYNEETGAATITGLAGFVAACKSPTKDVCAFDAFDRSKAENQVFGDESGNGLHFDATVAKLLSANKNAFSALENWNDSYPSAYSGDRENADSLGHASDYRQNIYNPMYYLCDAYEGAGTSEPAPHWRIRTGIEQGDTASTTEINLALALQSAKKVKDVDFATVWGQGHTMAETTGSGSENFIAWVNGICQ